MNGGTTLLPEEDLYSSAHFRRRSNSSSRVHEKSLAAMLQVRGNTPLYIVINSLVSRDVTSFDEISVRHVGVPRVSNLC